MEKDSEEITMFNDLLEQYEEVVCIHHAMQGSAFHDSTKLKKYDLKTIIMKAYTSALHSNRK